VTVYAGLSDRDTIENDVPLTMSVFQSKEVRLFSDHSESQKKTWEELTAAAATETDPEELAMILEELLAALEERERVQLLEHNPSPS